MTPYKEKYLSSRVYENKHSKDEILLQLVQRVNLLGSQSEATEIIKDLYKNTQVIVVSFINAHGYNLCCSDPDFAKALINSDVILRDGIGMELLYRVIGKNPMADMNGTDYIPILLDHFKGHRIALLGTKILPLKKAAEKLSSLGHQVVLIETGFHELEHYLNLVENVNPDIVILGMGMPKQEKLSMLIKASSKSSCMIINGGAIIDYWGDKIHRAPIWLRRVKLEWFFRFLHEPKRLFSRYIIGNYIFLRRIQDLKKSIASKKDL